MKNLLTLLKRLFASEHLECPSCRESLPVDSLMPPQHLHCKTCNTYYYISFMTDFYEQPYNFKIIGSYKPEPKQKMLKEPKIAFVECEK